MNEDDIFDAVKKVNSAIVKAQRNVEKANELLEDVLPVVKELVDATRKHTRQTSLDEFTTEKAILTTAKDVKLLAKSNLDSKLLSELFSLEDIRKMLGDKR
tara:strand:+ start:125 stop:427 length:303 start_codon:yes stop_codon:yes gene_type:complete